MRILITGGTGFVGSHVVKEFLGAGHTVRVLVRRTSDISSIEDLDVEFIYGDLAQKNSLTQPVEEIDVLVNLATTMGGTAQEFDAATVKGTFNLFVAAERAGVKRVVHTSSIVVLSSSVLDGKSEIPEDGAFESNPAFLSDYVKSKQESERTALSFNDRNKLQVIVLRPGLVFGPRGTWKLPRMGYGAGKYFFIIGNGQNLIPVIYVKNLANVILLSAEKADVPGGSFNIIENERFTQRQFLERYRRDVHPKLKIICVPYWICLAIAKVAQAVSRQTGIPNPFQFGHIKHCYTQLTYSTRRTQNLLTWKQPYGKERALTETMAYFSEKKKVYHSRDIKDIGKIDKSLPPVRIAMIGCGIIARTHMKFLSSMDNVRVIACCDPDLKGAKKLAEEWNIPSSYESAEIMLERETPDAVHIMTPPQMNLSLALLAINHGCHLLIEKPMALNVKDAETIIQAADDRGVKLCVDHNHLYDSVMIEARRFVESGALGQVIWVDSYYGFDLGHNRTNRYMLPGGERNWNFQLLGGLFNNLLPHPLSVALDILGEPINSYGHARYFRILPYQSMDELRILLETPNAGGLVTISLAASPGFQTLTIYGTKGSVLVDFNNKLFVPQFHRSHIPKSISRFLMNMSYGKKLVFGTLKMSWKVLRKKWIHFDGMATLFREFYLAIQEDHPSPITSKELINLMHVMDKTWDQIGPQNIYNKKKGN